MEKTDGKLFPCAYQNTGQWKKSTRKKTDDYLHDLVAEVLAVEKRMLDGKVPDCVQQYTAPTLPDNIASEKQPRKEDAVALPQSRLAQHWSEEREMKEGKR